GRPSAPGAGTAGAGTAGTGTAGADGWSDPGWDESSWPAGRPETAQAYAGEPYGTPASVPAPHAPAGSAPAPEHGEEQPPEPSWGDLDWPDDAPDEASGDGWGQRAEGPRDRARTVPPVDPPWLHRGAGEGGPDLVPTLVADLADATVAALRGRADSSGAAAGAGPGGCAPATLETAVSRAIAAAGAGLRDNGVLPTPPYARPDRARADAAALLGIGVQRVRDVLNTGSEQGRPLLLCPPAQLSLLSRDPAEARSVAFAPQAVRPSVETTPGGRGPDGEPAAMVWTEAGRFAGTLRLVPLRAGVVENVRVRTWAQDGSLTTPGDGTTGTVADQGEEWAQR
ncbi:hypothetical protein ACWDUG_33760, partial [Streptomyces cellulosae]